MTSYFGYQDIITEHSCDEQIDSVARYNRNLQPYEAQLAMFKTKQDEYNSAMTAENARKGDFFANLFEPEVFVPERPHAPWVPEAFEGVTVEFTEPEGDAETPHQTVYFLAENLRGRIRTSVTTHLVSHIGSVATDDLNMNATGSVFGIGGQGAMAMPNPGVKAFTINMEEDGTGISATDQAVMIVNIFPFDATTTGLATRNITIQASSVPFYADFTELPFTARAPEAPEVNLVAGVDGSKVLTAGLAAVAITMSLY